MNSSPFHIFSWHRPFLPDLKAFVEEVTENRPGQALIIVPNKRPRRYFADLFRAERKPGALPRMIAFPELVDAWLGGTPARALYLANRLDQVAGLHECVLNLAKDDQKLASHFANMDMAAFLPWGLRLAALLEEIFIQGAKPQNMDHLDGEVELPAAALLGAITRIHSNWRALLAAKGWTTSGLNHQKAREGAKDIPAAFLPDASRHVFIAGFYALNGTEEALFHSLWQAGARVCIHSEPEIIKNGADSWFCREHVAWLRRWKTGAEIAAAAPESSSCAKINFFAGYDLHSQLEEARARLGQAGEQTPSTAIVLSHPELLLPVLHHLPDKNINISMGYPLNRSPVGHLLEELFNPVVTTVERNGQSLLYWRDFLKIATQPYLNMLKVPGIDGLELRRALHILANTIRKGSKFVNPAKVLEACSPQLSLAEMDFLRACVATVLPSSEDLATTKSLAEALNRVCQFLLTHGGDIWERFPLDAEALARVVNCIIPALKNNALADTPFPPAIPFGMLRDLLAAERVPFEADPLVGIQVLGMLETRLLHFDRLLILDATDDILPGTSPQDPLLPDPLRPALGLPDARQREAVTAYNLRRLCAGAKDVQFFWQEGLTRSRSNDGKKARSRFVEQLIWECEKASGKLMEPGGGQLEVAKAYVAIAPRQPKAMPCLGAVAEARDKFLRGRISSTRLDVFLGCPLRFARRFLLKINPANEVNEGDDPPAVGKCIHDTLYDFYLPHKQKTVQRVHLSMEEMKKCLARRLNELNPRDNLPADSWLMLQHAAPHRLAKFLAVQPDETEVIELEKKLNVKLTIDGVEYNFEGIIDRLDLREGKLILLDYKTGKLKDYDREFLKNNEFFDRLRDPQITEDHRELYLDEIRRKLPSLQFPCYLTMLRETSAGLIGDAAFVDLADSGMEKGLLTDFDADEMEDVLTNMRVALDFVIISLRDATRFAPCESDACGWCEYSGLCAR